MKWERKKLADVCELSYGKSLPAPIRISGEYPVYGSAGEVGSHINYLVEGPGIIIGRKGSVGNVFYEKRSFFPIDTSYYVIPKLENDLRFLFYKLQTLGLEKLNTDAAVPGLNRNVAYEQSSDYPPLSTQRKITSILSAYDDLIENNLKRIKLLEEKAAIFYKNEFGDYQVSNKEFIELPKGWSVKTIGEIYGKLESGTRPKGGIDKELKEGVASVGAENVIGLGKYNYQSEKLITQEFFENMNRGKIEDRDVLVYKDGAYIGKTTLFQDEFPRLNCCVNEHVGHL